MMQNGGGGNMLQTLAMTAFHKEIYIFLKKSIVNHKTNCTVPEADTRCGGLLPKDHKVGKVEDNTM